MYNAALKNGKIHDPLCLRRIYRGLFGSPVLAPNYFTDRLRKIKAVRVMSPSIEIRKGPTSPKVRKLLQGLLTNTPCAHLKRHRAGLPSWCIHNTGMEFVRRRPTHREWACGLSARRRRASNCRHRQQLAEESSKFGSRDNSGTRGAATRCTLEVNNGNAAAITLIPID